MRAISIVIVGGGTAGWITANVLLQKLGHGYGKTVEITVVESRRVGIVGVGESTVPTIRTLLKFLKIKESEFINATQATFKQGILYRNWAETPGPDKNEAYFHPLDYSEVLTFSPSHWWLSRRAHLPGAKYAEDVCAQYRVAAAGRAPRTPDMKEYEGLFGYSYHLDAEALADFLSDLAMQSGVRRIYDDVLNAVQAEDGSIQAITTAEHGAISGDFFVDCTGFSGVLMSKTLGIGFESYKNELLCDRAVAFRVPIGEQNRLRPFTTATAKEAGWIWDIDLQHRQGVGYVYSSDHISAENAELALRQHIGPKSEKLSPRHLQMRVGRSKSFWEKNVVVIGLAGGFIEPLESTGIYLIETGAVQLADSLMGVLGLAAADEPRNRDQQKIYLHALRSVGEIYNKRMIHLYEEIRDFVKLHYFLTKRKDTSFWRDNVDPSSASDSLKLLLEGWNTRPPQNFDFMTRLSLFHEHNWRYVMLGMGWMPSQMAAFVPFTTTEMGNNLMDSVSKFAQRAIGILPDHRGYFQSMQPSRSQ
jgi:tryptophan halogenase